MFRFAFLAMMICTSAHGVPQEATSADSAREKDVYAIYSLMLTNPKTSHGADNNERYLIGVTTVPGVPQEPCVRPPKEREVEFREVLADFQRRKATPRQLKRELSIPKPYVLLGADEVRLFTEARSVGPRPRPQESERFRGVTDVFSLSDVYFNQSRTLALTAISTWCGSLCALYQWKVFEKLNTGRWEERDWSACISVARNSAAAGRPGSGTGRLIGETSGRE